MAALKSRQVGSIAVLTPKGYLTGGEETEALEKEIDRLIAEGGKHLVINLSETQHLNSTALGLLIRTDSDYVRRGGKMKLAAVDKRIENIFVITKLSLVFDVYSTEEQAIASFAERESV
jgi:anti-sigma B factor antagonist